MVKYDHDLGIFLVKGVMLGENMGTGKERLETGGKKQVGIQGNRLRLFYLREPVQDLVLYFRGDHGSDEKQHSRAHGLRIPSFRIRARNVLRLRPRISAAPFFPLTFH